MFAGVGQDAALGGDGLPVADGQRGPLRRRAISAGRGSSIERGSSRCGRDVDLAVKSSAIGSQGSPRVKPALPRGVPLHRRALGVAPEADAGDPLLERVLHPLRRDRHVAHADLVAVVERRRAAQRQQQHRRDARLRRADAAGDPVLVVVAEHPVRPAAGRQRRLVVARSARRMAPRVPGALMSWKLNGRCTPAQVRAVVGHQPLDRQVDLADQHAVVVLVDDAGACPRMTSWTSGRSVV